MTQEQLAEKLGVSFATVNRWENEQTKPSNLYWNQLRNLERQVSETESPYQSPQKPEPVLDFTASPHAIKVLAEGERLSFGHLMNPTFATEISSIDPLPHQRIAVYEHMLLQSPLRFLLADDAGAGKTIMTGLYVREMLSRRLLKRVLIISPAGLVGNWQREMSLLFNLPFRVIAGSDLRSGNPFVGPESDRAIVSVDTLATQRALGRLRAENVVPYDLVVFDEAHKLAANRGNDLRVRKTERYRLAESLAGVQGLSKEWQLSWHAHHLLLLTATPHMGKHYPYYALWKLLEPEVLSTFESFNEYPAERRKFHFIRRSKEEMVRLDGTPIYPPRVSTTHGYSLSQGAISEQTLYDQVTEYLRFVYNKAKLLNREAARLAMTVFQRRVASSTYAILCSLNRRIEKLDNLIGEVQNGHLTIEQLVMIQQRLDEDEDVFDSKTPDEESPEQGKEENEFSEEKLLQGVVASSLADLIAEKNKVIELRDLAKQVYDAGQESKFDKLKEFITDAQFSDEKVIIFTEHRDTLTFLVQRLNGLGYTNLIAQIHGGMDYSERERQVEFFRRNHYDGGARFLVCTDAAGEGINLQFCWIMINYDVPWNPARLEQRMGRIHRYLQEHDPVIIVNLVSPSTREGKVLNVLLKKMEKIRDEMKSDKVFDCVGRIFEGVSLRKYMELAVAQDPDAVAEELQGKLTVEQVKALEEREKKLYGEGGEVKRALPKLRTELENESFVRLIPGYVRRYIEQAAPMVGLRMESADGFFSLHPKNEGAIDPLLESLELYPEGVRDNLSVTRLKDQHAGIWLHPGEPVFEKFRELVSERLGDQGAHGGVFIDPTADRPYVFHLALVNVVRKADSSFPDLAREETLDCRLVGVKQFEGSEITECSNEYLLLLKEGTGIPFSAERLAVNARHDIEYAKSFITENIARKLALERKSSLLEKLPERESFLSRGFEFREAELANMRAKHSEAARSGSKKAKEALDEIKRQQLDLRTQQQKSLALLRREPELIAPGAIAFITHALVVPSSDPEDLRQFEKNVELVAMQFVIAHEEAEGATVKDVHTPPLAREAGLPDHPGFDILSKRPTGERRCIEVKGRLGVNAVELSDNEWAKACNLRSNYWLYTVYDCETPTPHLYRVRDPFANLLTKEKGGVLINPSTIISASEDHGS